MSRYGPVTQELVKEDPAEVISRYESGQFASNELCFKEYLKALVMTNRVDKVDLAKSLHNAVEPAGAELVPARIPSSVLCNFSAFCTAAPLRQSTTHSFGLSSISPPCHLLAAPRSCGVFH